MNAKMVKKTLLQQMENYLSGKISKEDYAMTAEEFYTNCADHIAETEFDKIFMENIPDCCTMNVDEPGNEDEKERNFQEILKDTYDQLVHLI